MSDWQIRFIGIALALIVAWIYAEGVHASPVTQAQLDAALGSNATTEDFSGIKYLGSNETPPDNQWVIIGQTLNSSTVIPAIATGEYASPAQGPGLVATGVTFSTGANNTPSATTTLVANATAVMTVPGILARFTNTLDISFSVAVNAVGFLLTANVDSGPLHIIEMIDVYGTDGSLLTQSEWDNAANAATFFFGDQESKDIGSIAISDIAYPSLVNGPGIADVTFGDPPAGLDVCVSDGPYKGSLPISQFSIVPCSVPEPSPFLPFVAVATYMAVRRIRRG